MSPLLTAACFLIVALVYGSAGFGGGSSYTALLTLSDLPPPWIPIVSLTCNIVVVAGSTAHFAWRGHLAWPLTWPFLAASVPCAYMGGRWPIRQELFLALLGAALVSAGLALVLRPVRHDVAVDDRPSRGASFAIGGALGLLSGLVGIGGGIFLAPVMLYRNWGNPKQVAAASALFILANSIAGLAGQLGKLATLEPLAGRWPLLLAVLLGGQAGSWLGSGPFPPRWVRTITAALVAAAGLRVLWRLHASA